MDLEPTKTRTWAAMPAVLVRPSIGRSWAHLFPPLTLRAPHRRASLRTPKPEWAIGVFLASYPSLPMTVLAPFYIDAELDDFKKEVAPLAHDLP